MAAEIASANNQPDAHNSDSKMDQLTNLSAPALAELAVQRGEGRFASNGAIVVETGHRTGRSPKDRFIVDEPSTSESIHWGPINQPISTEIFDALWDRVQVHVGERETITSTLHVGGRSRTLPTHRSDNRIRMALFIWARTIYLSRLLQPSQQRSLANHQCAEFHLRTRARRDQ